jgi:thioredoxin reductase
VALILPFPFKAFLKYGIMNSQFDVIIIGGSYSGLAAGMALGRALKKVLIIDSGEPCNRQAPHSHNFLTHDGKAPRQIASMAKHQVEKYDTVQFFSGLATEGVKTPNGFKIQVASGETFNANKLIFATGIRDLLPALPGLAECWGISVLHCPYCHGYEVRNEKTGILGNGEYGYDFPALILNWTKDLTLYTNGPSTLTAVQTTKLKEHSVTIVEKEIDRLAHVNGHLQHIIFRDGTRTSLSALYTHAPFEQHCVIPQQLGCLLDEDGYLEIDPAQKTTVDGIYACGDNVTRSRLVAHAVSMGTIAGMMVNKEICLEVFQRSTAQLKQHQNS